jgi:hypothetical protein
MPFLRKIAVGAWLVFTSSCATSFSSTGGVTAETSGHVGTEGRLEFVAATGSEEIRPYLSLAAGGGYLPNPGVGYGLLSPGVGLEFGQAPLWTIGGFYSPRYQGQPNHSPTFAQSGGVASQVLFFLKPMGGEHGRLLLGPRLAVEGGQGWTSSNTEGLIQLDLVLRWVTFDTTGNSWAF